MNLSGHPRASLLSVNPVTVLSAILPTFFPMPRNSNFGNYILGLSRFYSCQGLETGSSHRSSHVSLYSRQRSISNVSFCCLFDRYFKGPIIPRIFLLGIDRRQAFFVDFRIPWISFAALFRCCLLTISPSFKPSAICESWAIVVVGSVALNLYRSNVTINFVTIRDLLDTHCYLRSYIAALPTYRSMQVLKIAGTQTGLYIHYDFGFIAEGIMYSNAAYVNRICEHQHASNSSIYLTKADNMSDFAKGGAGNTTAGQLSQLRGNYESTLPDCAVCFH
ncbi:uncharacterized protein BDR25DRAFT_349597 [Lindgomyces ingoldianus]|uniref:Uncharacterized protein n=1 Tax=Lindgomyces ingoldianus TaxID=673940 RepID=A0ACB6RB55_9PLEO|nr:uncharacterized protein BDR25DRAFT_349597 [Lindgomyces ingoldianus]KAF2476518.1 hypothetical protein BDR25DRAFT_349597 [Lindgomyces ingoldianus]